MIITENLVPKWPCWGLKNICLRCLVVLQTWCEFYCWNFKKEVFKEDVRKRNDEYIYQNKLLVMTAICFTVHPLISESVCNICMILCAWNSPHPKNCYFDWKKYVFSMCKISVICMWITQKFGPCIWIICTWPYVWLSDSLFLKVRGNLKSTPSS